MAALSVGFMTRLGTVALPPTDGAATTFTPPEGTPVPDSAPSKASAAQGALQNAIVYFLTSQSL